MTYVDVTWMLNSNGEPGPAREYDAKVENKRFDAALLPSVGDHVSIIYYAETFIVRKRKFFYGEDPTSRPHVYIYADDPARFIRNAMKNPQPQEGER